MRSKAARVALILFVMLIILLVIGQIAAPRIAASYVEREIKKRYPDCGKVDVSVKAFPFLKLLFSEYDELVIKSSGITVEEVKFDKVSMESNSGKVASYDAWVTQQEIFKVFSTTNSYLSNPTLDMEKGFINVYGTVIDSSPQVNVHLKGTLKVVDATQIFLDPVLIEVESPYDIPAIANQIEERANTTPVFNLKENLDFSVTEIDFAAGMMHIKGYVDLDRILNKS